MIKIFLRLICIALLTSCMDQPIYADQTIRLVSQNMNRLFDNHNDGKHEKVVSLKTYQKRINQLTQKIISTFQKPDIIALQEVENIHILNDVSKKLKTSGLDYQAVMIEGHDISHINVGFLVKKSFHISQQRQLFKDVNFEHSDRYLFSRPPLLIEVCADTCLSVINLHLRSMRKLDARSHDSKRIARKRRLQAETIARWVNDFQRKYPQRRLILLGDFNALPISDEYVDVLGIIRGNPDLQKPKWKSKDLIERDLIDLTTNIQLSDRFSYIYKKRHQQLDYLLISKTSNFRLNQIKFGHIDYKLSDHAPLIGELTLQD
jgi:uncharacterized protein